jgi:flagellar protein FliL
MPVEPVIQPAESGAKSRSKLLLVTILGLLIVLLAGGGFFAYTILLAPQGADHAAGLKAEAEIKQRLMGEMYPLEVFVVNLLDPRGKRYLKVQLEMELQSPEAVERAARKTPKLRDTVIMMLTNLTFEDVMSPEGKIRIRDELLQRFNQDMRPDRVTNIYFTEFVVQ